jgi:hypothetical protein
MIILKTIFLVFAILGTMWALHVAWMFWDMNR